MKPTTSRIAVIGLLLAVGPLSAAPLVTQLTAPPPSASPSYSQPGNSVPSITLPCARACMEGVADRFMGALASHVPQRLPHSADAGGEREPAISLVRRDGVRPRPD